MLPVLKLAVAAAIAIALVKLAFFPAAEQAIADEAFPGAVFEEPLAAVERGSIENAVSVDGTVVPVEAVPVRSTRAGTVSRVDAADGQQVAAGDVLYTVRVESQPQPAADGTVDDAATATLRDELRAGRPAELPVFDMGPPLEQILANAQAETGLPAPRAPIVQ